MVLLNHETHFDSGVKASCRDVCRKESMGVGYSGGLASHERGKLCKTMIVYG